ncbi:hypothetical protein V8E53_000556 [Lactarius tabidus]
MTTLLSKTKSVIKAPKSMGAVKIVDFLILKSPHERFNDQSIVQQEIDESTTTTEIVWRFSRYPENSGMRIAFKQNPHFYHGLPGPDEAARYGSKFNVNPLNDFTYACRHQIRTIYVLVDKSCRLFLYKPPTERIFGNLWKPHQTVILKDVVGKLESEDIVLRDIGGEPRILKPVENGRAVVNAAVRSQNLDLMIRDISMPVPDPTEWKRLPSLTKPEPRIVSTSTLGSDTLSSTPTAVNPSDYLFMPVDPRTSLHVNVELPPGDITQGPQKTAPADDPTTELPPRPEQESRSANPGGARGGRRNPAQMFPSYTWGFRKHKT